MQRESAANVLAAWLRGETKDRLELTKAYCCLLLEIGSTLAKAGAYAVSAPSDVPLYRIADALDAMAKAWLSGSELHFHSSDDALRGYDESKSVLAAIENAEDRAKAALEVEAKKSAIPVGTQEVPSWLAPLLSRYYEQFLSGSLQGRI